MDGEVVVRCYKGRAEAVKRRSPYSLFHHGFATFGEDEVYDHKHSEGFIRLFSLPMRIRALLGLSEDATVLALLPGNRRSEIAHIAPPLLQAAAQLQRERPGLEAVLPVAPGLRPLIEAALAQHAPGLEIGRAHV